MSSIVISICDASRVGALLSMETIQIVSDFAYGNAEYCQCRREKHAHKQAFTPVLREMYQCLEHKRAYEPMMLELYSVLTALYLAGAIRSTNYHTFDVVRESQARAYGQRFSSPIPADTTSICFRLTWNDRTPAPAVILIAVIKGEWSLMTPNYSSTEGRSYGIFPAVTDLIAQLTCDWNMID